MRVIAALTAVTLSAGLVADQMWTHNETSDIAVWVSAPTPLPIGHAAPSTKTRPTPTAIALPTAVPSATVAPVDHLPGRDLRTAMEHLEAAIATQVSKSSDQTGGADVSIAVGWHETLIEQNNVGGPLIVNSASTAKAYWTVAAVRAAGADAVELWAEPTFRWSDNDATARIIDFVGLDGINLWAADSGLQNTYAASWPGSVSRYASDAPTQGYTNTTTTTDAVRFLSTLANNRLLAESETDRVLEWMRLSPNTMDPASDWSGMLPSRLPPEVAARTAHKAGWLPPGCCDALDNLLIDIGLVPIPATNDQLAIAVIATNGSNFAGQAEWIADTTRALFDAVATGTLS